MRRKLTVFVLAIVILLQALNGEWVHDEWEYVGSYQKKAVPTFQQSPKIKVVLEYTGGYEKKEPIQGDKDRAQLFYESKKPKKESALSKAIDKVNSSQEVKLCKEFLTGVTFGHENSDSLLNSLFGQMAGLDMSREQREYWEKLEQTWQTSQFEQQKIPADQSGAPSQAFEWGASIGSAGGTAEVLAAIASALGSVPIGGNGGNPGGAVTNGYGNVYQVPASAGAGSVGVSVSAMTGGGGSTGQGKDGKKSDGKEDSKGAGKGYTAPTGGGGVTNTIKTGNSTVTFGHGGRHVPGTDVSAVEQAIAGQVPKLKAGEYLRDIPINVNWTDYLYNAYGLEVGVGNVGTYHPVP